MSNFFKINLLMGSKICNDKIWLFDFDKSLLSNWTWKPNRVKNRNLFLEPSQYK